MCFFMFIPFVDINECAKQNGGCHNRCVNTQGDYYCECTNGKLNADGVSCSAAGLITI